VQDLDEAVLRRFESKICVDAPDSTARAELILHFLRGIDHRLDHEDAADLANLTDGWSCSHIETLCREAAMAPVRRINGLNGPQYVTLSASYSHQAVSPSPSESHLDDKSFVSPLDINEEAGAALGRSQTATSVLGKRGPNTTADNTCINGAQKHTVLHEEREETEYGHRDPIVSPVTYSDFIEAHSSVTIGMAPAVMPDVDGLPQLGPGVDNQVEI
jgi:SpoVK/Ycf46/Vps4 family AAA+-type ATPase